MPGTMSYYFQPSLLWSSIQGPEQAKRPRNMYADSKEHVLAEQFDRNLFSCTHIQFHGFFALFEDQMKLFLHITRDPPMICHYCFTCLPRNWSETVRPIHHNFLLSCISLLDWIWMAHVPKWMSPKYCSSWTSGWPFHICSLNPSADKGISLCNSIFGKTKSQGKLLDKKLWSMDFVGQLIIPEFKTLRWWQRHFISFLQLNSEHSFSVHVLAFAAVNSVIKKVILWPKEPCAAQEVH